MSKFALLGHIFCFVATDFTFATIHDEAMSMARELVVDELHTQTILRRTVKLAHSNDEGLETFHDHEHETTVATGVNVKNLTYFVEHGKPEAKGTASDLFPGSGTNFGKRVSESHIMAGPDGRKWLESYAQPTAPVYAENFESFFYYGVQQIHLADAHALMVKEGATRRIGYVQPPAAPTIIWVRNLQDMALAGYNINTPQAVHTDLKSKDCLKIPTTTPMSNTLMAGWNNNCTPLFRSQGNLRTYIPFADYKIKPLNDMAIIAGESIHPLTAGDGDMLHNGFIENRKQISGPLAQT